MGVPEDPLIHTVSNIQQEEGIISSSFNRAVGNGHPKIKLYIPLESSWRILLNVPKLAVIKQWLQVMNYAIGRPRWYA